ncbi:MAG TPA: phytase [Oligoflexus sp.]|uniref:phytase n=1 Tax=Oligoflexus sp. TaxID=1971216 RepID=UPI002D22F67D|nr:phytase [Oligoflexus sp.]HYX36716.1 phytase [Oligoflexus sp.]
MRILFCMSCLLPMSLSAQVSTLEALVETTPIPAGFSDSDDAAIWKHPKDSNKSLILGTSKYDEDGQGGLGVYDLEGRQLQFFAGSKLNSVDIIKNVAVASNRSENALDIYRIRQGKVNFLTRTVLKDSQGKAFEPYGLCLAEAADDDDDVRVYLPTKSGLLYEYTFDDEYQAELEATYDLAALVRPVQDAFIQSVVTKETQAEGEMDELQENLDERFILEGCVFDARTQKLYVGMENFGIWSLSTAAAKPIPKLVIPVQGSWTDIEQWGKPGVPRVTDDIEGMDILHANGRSYLLFSSQGISEFTLYDLTNLTWLGNFKITFGASDAITFTDGLAVQSGALGQRYPEGVLVVHDDENTQPDGTLAPANYKVISLADLWKIFPKTGN